MTTVFLIGGRDDAGLENLIKSNLTNTYSITYIKDDSVSRLGKGYNLLVLDTPRLGFAELDECVVVMKDFGEVPSAALPEKSIVITNAENTEQLEKLEFLGRRAITCGKTGRDTFSYTSLTHDGIVISLNREITAFSGKKIQPLEIPVKFTPAPDKSDNSTDNSDNINIYDAMAYTALRLVLDDYDSEIGFLY